MIRVALTVALAVALLATALPAVETARVDHTATALDSTAERIDRAATALATAEDATADDVAGAQRVVSVRLPPRSLSSVGVAYLALGGVPGDRERDVVAYRLVGHAPRTHRVTGVDLRTPDGPLVVRGTGEHEIVLELVRTGDGVAVAVRLSADQGATADGRTANDE